MRDDRWEIGSDFPWMELPPLARLAPTPWESGLLLSSGRDALRLALDVGVGTRGWRRLFVPDYFCQEVVAALVRPGLELQTYQDHPLIREPSLPDAQPGDAVLVANYFGLRSAGYDTRDTGVDIIEDHSHDPTSDWARASTADFCIASLRKSIPLTDGGVLWSPRGHGLPAQPGPTSQRERVTSTRLAAMVLKAMYLAGHDVDKEAYRQLARRAERGMAVPSVAAMSHVARAALAAFPLDAWRESRSANRAMLGDLLRGTVAEDALIQADGRGVPLSCVLVVDSAERREAIRRRLIESRIYPAILWPLERPVLPPTSGSLDVSRRMLSIPCDGRYGPDDILRLGEVVRHVLST